MRLLLTGAGGFTGQHVINAAKQAACQVIPLNADLTNAAAVDAAVYAARPTHVLHLAAISAVTHQETAALYAVNVVGTTNLLNSLRTFNEAGNGDVDGQKVGKIEKIVLASSGNVYGNIAYSPVAECVMPKPVNHYACSKLSMEHMAATFADVLPIVIARPFNYTGPGHDERFVIPKLITAFARRDTTVELGNINVEREFNDVRMVVAAYFALLENGIEREIYNICSSVGHSLLNVIQNLEAICDHRIKVEVNPAFVRSNEVHRLVGDQSKLTAVAKNLPDNSLSNLLIWMLNTKANQIQKPSRPV